MATPTFTKTGTKATTAVKLSKTIFEVEVTNHELLKQAYNAYLANSRQSSATTLKRGEVRGGGKKPWKQKGTGRARAGSIRSPIWRGGGITFGPSGDENYTKNLPKKAKRLALKQALTLASQSNSVAVVEAIAVSGKTKDLQVLLDKLEMKRNVVIVDGRPTIEVRRSAQNIAGVTVVAAEYLNVYTIMNADHLLITKPAVAAIEKWLGGKA